MVVILIMTLGPICVQNGCLHCIQMRMINTFLDKWKDWNDKMIDKLCFKVLTEMMKKH